MNRKCRNCKYYRNEPHIIVWEFDERVDSYDGLCVHPDSDTMHTNAGDTCYLFRKKVTVGPALGAYNKTKVVQ